jgi:enterochelin esterase-like enzyme
MGLTGWPLLWLTIVVAVSSVAGVMWLWPRLVRRRPAHVAARLGVILLSQALLIAAAAVYANDSFGFFSSWSELFGSWPHEQESTWTAASASAAKIAPLTVTGSSFGTTFRAAAVFPRGAGFRLAGVIPGSPGRAGHDGRLERFGAVLRVTIHGEYSGIVAVGDYVYLPPQYFQPAYLGKRFPVILTFAGYPNVPVNLIRLLRLPAIAARLGAADRIRPAIYVMVNPSVALPRDTECTNIPAGLQVATFFGRDVPLAVERTFAAQADRSGWAAIGYSTGAYCAVKIAMLYPGQFTAAVGLSGYYNAVRDHTTGSLYGGNLGYRNENDLDWRLIHLPAPPVSVLAASSASGEKTLPDTLAFLHLIKPPMRGYALVLPRGGHNYFTWRRELPQSLEWLSRRLTAPRNSTDRTGRPLHA